MTGFHTHPGRATPEGTGRFAGRQGAAPDFYPVAFPEKAAGGPPTATRERPGAFTDAPPLRGGASELRSSFGRADEDRSSFGRADEDRSSFGRADTEGNPRGALGLRLSSVGLGTYLGNTGDEADRSYRAAIIAALRAGVNVLDTAVNYRCQRSERSIGDALEELFHAKEVKRDEVFISTKGGYVPYDGAPPRDHWEHLRRTVLAPGLAKEGEIVGGVHCLAPGYLRNQVETSLRNLRLGAVDLYYLHNPEQQFGEVDRKAFARRMGEAFRLLEELASQGKVGVYGVATWDGLRVPPEDPGHLSLEELLDWARGAGGPNHRFRAVQLPFNLAMAEAAFAPTQTVGGEPMALLEAARRLGVAVFCSASLFQGRLAGGLPPELTALLPGLASDAQRALQFVRSAPGVTTALVGMGRVTHVEHNLALKGVPRAPPDTLPKLMAASRG